MKPVGLEDPKQVNVHLSFNYDKMMHGTLYNIVGFQTHLKWGAQKKSFALSLV